MTNAARDFSAGVALLGRGFGLIFASRRRLILGVIPALITTVLMLGGLAAIAYTIGDITQWLTGFADGWSDGVRDALRIALGIVIVTLYLSLSVLLFTAITLIIGGPFYEAIAEEIEDELGGVPDAERVPGWRCALIGLRDGVLFVGLSVLIAIPLLLAGFLPLLGQTVVPAIAIAVGGYLLGIELTAIPFARRGRSLKERRRILSRRRSLVLGLSVPAYLLCLVPFAALLVIPAAMAGGTVLAHRLITEGGHVTLGERAA